MVSGDALYGVLVDVVRALRKDCHGSRHSSQLLRKGKPMALGLLETKASLGVW